MNLARRWYTWLNSADAFCRAFSSPGWPSARARVAVRPRDPQRRAARQDRFRLWRELALALPLEPVERAGEVTHHQVEVAVAVPVDGEGPGANLLRQLLVPFRGDEERPAVG